MSKHNKKTSKPNIAPATLARVRLERLWLNPAAAETPAAQAQAELTAATRGLKPEAVVEGVLGVFQSAPPATQAQLEAWLPQWLAGQNAVEALERLLRAGRLAEPLRPIGTRWLAGLGREVATVVLTGANAFYKGWILDNQSQAAVTLLWYSNAHKNRVTGLQFLIDYNPPWEGAIKDVLHFPTKAPQVLERTILEMGQETETDMFQTDAAIIKDKLLAAFQQNRAMDIRLPKDLVLYRQLFFDYVLTLPDMSNTLVVTPDDFDALSQTGRSAEDLSLFERTVGGIMRLPNGDEVFIGNLGDDGLFSLDDFDDTDDLDDADSLEDDEDDPITLD